jgi:hypothetical protein
MLGKRASINCVLDIVLLQTSDETSSFHVGHKEKSKYRQGGYQVDCTIDEIVG